MKVRKLAFLIVILILFITVSSASETTPEIVGKANLHEGYNYSFLDTTSNGKYYYALYYVTKENNSAEPTVACFRDKESDGFFNCWYYQKLKTTPNRILSTENYLICLDEIGKTIELYQIRESGSLVFIEQSDMVLNFRAIVKGKEALIIEE